MMFDVSVIVPVYGVERYIERCARSILGQTYTNFEVIFVNDCTKDRSEELLLAVIDQFKNSSVSISLIRHEVNKGISAARETGLLAATGNYVLYVDSDDFIAPDMVETMLEKARLHDSDIVFCDYYEVKEGAHKYVTQSVEHLSSHAMLVAMLSQQRDWTPWNKLFKRELATSNNVHWPVGINMAEDLLVVVKLFALSKRVDYVNKALYYYNRDNVNSLVNTISINACNQSLSAIHQTIEFLEHKGLLDELNESLVNIKLMLRFNMLYTLDETLLNKLFELYPETNQSILNYGMAGFHWRLLMYSWVNRHTGLFKGLRMLIELKKLIK
jgi:glycosyltransferase involved in cell wall biosynthesis